MITIIFMIQKIPCFFNFMTKKYTGPKACMVVINFFMTFTALVNLNLIITASIVRNNHLGYNIDNAYGTSVKKINHGW